MKVVSMTSGALKNTIRWLGGAERPLTDRERVLLQADAFDLFVDLLFVSRRRDSGNVTGFSSLVEKSRRVR